jgi:hypothetical protein
MADGGEFVKNVESKLSNLETVKEVQAALSRARTISSAWHAGIKARRALYNLQHYKGRAKPYEDRYADPTPISTVDMAVSVLMGGDLEFHVKGFNPSQSEERETGDVSKFLHGLWQINEERAESSLNYDLCLNFVRDGAAVLYTVWDPELENQYSGMINQPDEEMGSLELEAFLEPPIRTQVIDPLKIFPVPGGMNRWSFICRVEKMSVYEVEIMYGIPISRYGHLSINQKMDTSDELIDFWRIIRRMEEDENGTMRPKVVVQNAVIYSDTTIFPIRDMEGYEDLPFTISFFKPVDKDEPKGWGHSILDPMITTLDQLEKSFNRRARQILVYSSMPPVTRVQSDRHINVPNVIGQPIRLGPGEEFAFPQWPGSPPDVEKHMQYLQNKLAMTGFTEAFYGIGGEGMSGYAISRLSDVNKLKIEVPLRNLELLFTLWARKTMRLLVNFAVGKVVRTYGRLKGEDFIAQMVGEDASNFMIKSLFRVKYPGDEVRKHAMATQIRGLLSDKTIMSDYLDVEQPDDERRRKIREMAQLHPMMQQYLMITAMIEMAMDGDPAAAMALQSMQQAQAQQGMAQEQPEAMQPEGMMSSTGQPTQQEQGLPTAQEERMMGPLGGRPGGGGAEEMF